MSNVKELMKESFTGVGIYRESFPVARYFFDVHINDDGISGYYVWKRNDFRLPIIHPILDRFKRRGRNGKPRKEAVEEDNRNFFVAFDDIQGAVTYHDHKEIQLLSNQEQIYFYFRPVDDYEKFVDALEAHAGDKVYSRDDVKSPDAVYVS